MVHILPHVSSIARRMASGADTTYAGRLDCIEWPAIKELVMNAVKSKSAWMALLAAGGLYAWNNRDKIQSWLNTQRDQLSPQSSSSLPATGATRRIDSRDFPAPSSTRGIYNNE